MITADAPIFAATVREGTVTESYTVDATDHGAWLTVTSAHGRPQVMWLPEQVLSGLGSALIQAAPAPIGDVRQRVIPIAPGIVRRWA